MSQPIALDPTLDFAIERFIDAPTRLVWEALTKPEHLKEWYMPKVWGRVSHAELELRPGGIIRIDIIVGEIPDDAAPDLATHPLYEEAPVVVAGRQHPLATRRSCTPQMLASYPWIIAPENSPLRAEWERLFADRRPEAPVECGSIMIIGRLLTASDLLLDESLLTGEPVPALSPAIPVRRRSPAQAASQPAHA